MGGHPHKPTSDLDPGSERTFRAWMWYSKQGHPAPALGVAFRKPVLIAANPDLQELGFVPVLVTIQRAVGK